MKKILDDYSHLNDIVKLKTLSQTSNKINNLVGDFRFVVRRKTNASKRDVSNRERVNSSTNPHQTDSESRVERTLEHNFQRDRVEYQEYLKEQRERSLRMKERGIKLGWPKPKTPPKDKQRQRNRRNRTTREDTEESYESYEDTEEKKEKRRKREEKIEKRKQRAIREKEYKERLRK